MKGAEDEGLTLCFYFKLIKYRSGLVLIDNNYRDIKYLTRIMDKKLS